MDLVTKIDRAIKEVWVKNIYQDYCDDYLLKEDSLKNSFYHHLRNHLGDGFLKRNLCRIYTEFKVGNYYADLVVAKLKPKKDFDEHGYLYDRVAHLIAIIEFKYKSGLANEPFLSDVKKARSYIKSKLPKAEDCQLYLGFIHEASYNENNTWWLNKRQRESWASSRLSEMFAFYNIDKNNYFETRVVSHNGLNNDLNHLST